MTRGRIIGAIVALVILGLIIGGVFLSARSRVPEVTVATAERDDLGVTVSASGKVEADEQADVFPPTTTTIDDLRVVDGQRVRAGQVLAILDREQLEQQVDQAQATFQQASAQVEQIQNQQPSGADRTAQAANVTAAAKGLDNARRALDEARDTLREATSTLTRRAARQQVRQAEAGVAQARAAYLGAQAQLNKLNASSGASLSAAQSNRDAASESLRIARKNLNEADLRAPISGVVIFNVIGTPAPDGTGPKPTEGAAVTPQAPPFTIVQLGALRFNADVDEVDVPKLKRGMTAEVTLDAFPGDGFKTEVQRVQVRAVQTATGGTVFPVYLQLERGDKRVLIGMKGDAAIETSSLKGALTVPVEAVLEDGEQSYVFVVEGEVVRRRDVKVGTLTDTRAQIESGIEEGDRVVISGTGNLRDGMTVRTK